MRVTVIGRLHYLVTSRSRGGTEHLVDLEPQGGLPYFCSCERFNENTHHKRTPCHHLELCYRKACQDLSRRRKRAA